MWLTPQQSYDSTSTLTKSVWLRWQKITPQKPLHTPLPRVNYGLLEIMDDLSFFMIGLDDALGDALISWDKFSPTCQWFLVTKILLRIDLKQRRFHDGFIPQPLLLIQKCWVEALAKHTTSLLVEGSSKRTMRQSMTLMTSPQVQNVLDTRGHQWMMRGRLIKY